MVSSAVEHATQVIEEVKHYCTDANYFERGAEVTNEPAEAEALVIAEVIESAAATEPVESVAASDLSIAQDAVVA
jgi:hypothetical protein